MHRGTCFPAPVSEGVERVVGRTDRLIARHLSTVFQNIVGQRGKGQSVGSTNRRAIFRDFSRARDASRVSAPPRWTTTRPARERKAHPSPSRARSQNALRLNPVFETIQFPTRVASLHASLTDVNRDDFPHDARSDPKSRVSKSRVDINAHTCVCVSYFTAPVRRAR